jgi:hypothetical protein
MKVFISHAVDDRELVRALVNLLQLGAGLSHNQIFCSSLSGSIPNGEFFVEHIVTQLLRADAIIAVLSQSYFGSQFCLAEAGAAQLRKIAHEATLYSLIVPPVTYSDLQGVLYGVQVGSIVAPTALGELRDVVTKGKRNRPGTPRWEECREEFITKLEAWMPTGLLSQLPIADVFVARTSRDDITYKAKLRIVLTNATGKKIKVGPAYWDGGSVGVPLQAVVSPLLWQLVENGPEATTVSVPAGTTFRTWIGLAQSVTDREVLRRCALKRLGSLRLSVVVGGDRFDGVIQL